MGIFEQFPYTNFHELNLDWILRALKELDHTIEQFVAINALKYADPIQWNITNQYEKNTIVIDPVTGVAYISVQPVPAGVALTNTDYWTVVFDLGSFVTKAAKNFTSNYEEATTLTATFPTTAGDWLIWGDTLYKTLVNIIAGDTYVVDSNIKKFTMEDVIGHLDNLSTTDKSNLVAAINEVLQLLIDTTGDLDDLDTSDKSNLVAAINEVVNIIGDLNNLVTPDNTSIVNAINSNENVYIDVTKHGVIGDGSTDNYDALYDLMHEIAAGTQKKTIVFFPEGKYIISDTIFIPSNVTVMGSGYASEIYYNGDYGYFGAGLICIGDNITIKNLRLNHYEAQPEIISGNMYGAIGISNKVFSEWTSKHMTVGFTSVEDHSNITVEKIVSESNYVVQCETSGASFDHITYRDIIAPRAKVRYQATNPQHINDVTIDNVTASFVGSIGSQSGTTDKAYFDNIKCNLMSNTALFADICNCTFDTVTNINVTSGIQACALWAGANNRANLVNCKFIGSSPDYPFYIVMGANHISHLVNCYFENNASVEPLKHLDNTSAYYAVNCDFGTSNSIDFLTGAAVNCKGTFIQRDNFRDLSTKQSIIILNWTATTTNWGDYVTDTVTLPIGFYLMEIQYPTVSSTLRTSIATDWVQTFYGDTHDRTMMMFKINSSQTVGLRALNSGITLSDLSNGTVKITKLS